MVAAVEGEIPVPQTPLDRLRLAETARILHTIGRLESDESTSNVAHAKVEMTREWLLELDDKVQRALRDERVLPDHREGPSA
jgi:hypothetical protein